MFKKIKNLVFLFLIGSTLLFLSFQGAVAQQENSVFVFSLNFQKYIKNFLSKIFGFSEDSFYKEKYFQLLEELAKIKIALKENQELSLENLEIKYRPKIEKVEVLKQDSLGNFYISNFSGIKEGMIVLDPNWILVGKVDKVHKDYSLVKSLLYPDFSFNVLDFKGNLLGLANSISNGFLEINYVDPKTNINKDDLVLTAESDIFPEGFLIGSVTKVIKSTYDVKVIVKLLANFNSDKFIILK